MRPTRHTGQQRMICLTSICNSGLKNGVMISLASVYKMDLAMLTIIECKLITTEYVIIMDN